MMKVRETRLNLLYKKDDQIRYRRIPPRVVADRSYPFRHRVNFTGDNCYRIQNGKRSGTVVELSEIAPDEKFVPAGIDKVLEMGRAPNQLSTHRKGDQNILQLLDHVFAADAATCVEAVCPTIYITVPANSGKIYLRNNGNAVRYLTSTQEYDPQETPNQNLRRLQTKLALNAGGNRKAFPFEYVTGHGVLAAGAMTPSMSFGKWYSVPSVDLDLEHIRIAV
jgi:hypothetical protein